MISSVAYNGQSVIMVGQSFVSLSARLVQSVCMVKRSVLVSMISSIAYYDLSVSAVSMGGQTF